MGVKSCNRHYCDSIMCDTYIPEIGYICSGCQKEFKNFLIAKRSIPISNTDVKHMLKKFMSYGKDEFSERPEFVNVDDFFKEYTQ